MGMSEFYGSADEEAVIATKFGNVRGSNGERLGVCGARSPPCRPSTRCGAGSLRRRSCRRSASSASASSPTAPELSDDDLRRIDEAAPRDSAAGDRYADMSPLNR